MSDLLGHLKRKILAFAGSYPDGWESEDDYGSPPLANLVEAFADDIQGATQMCLAAQRFGAELRRKYDYVTPDDTDEASADYLRGLACLAAEVLHGSVCTDFGGGDKLTAEQVAFYIVDDWWIGRDDRPIEEWPDIRPVREQLMLDALDLTAVERSNVLGFSAKFIRRHPKLIGASQWGLGAVGSNSSFEREVWAATGDDCIWRGVYYFAKLVLAQQSNQGTVN